MDTRLLALAIVDGLNDLIEEDPDIRKDISALFECAVPASKPTVLHPSLQCRIGADSTLGVIGLLNGLVGTVKTGPRKGEGLISMIVEENGRILRFEIT